MDNNKRIREALLLLASAIEYGRISGVYEDVCELIKCDENLVKG